MTRKHSPAKTRGLGLTQYLSSWVDSDCTDSDCTDSDCDPALRYYHEDAVAYQRGNGLHFYQSFDEGFWYNPGGCLLNCDQRVKGVVFEDSD